MLLLSCQPALCRQIVCLFQCIYLSRLKGSILGLIFNYCDAFTMILKYVRVKKLCLQFRTALDNIVYDMAVDIVQPGL